MGNMWGIHNDTIAADDLVAGGFISIGYEAIGDLRLVGDDQQAMKEEVEAKYPSIKAGAIPVWAGTLRRFAFALEIGDIVIAPNRASSTLNFGRITGEYTWDDSASEHKNRRKVTWLITDVARTDFPKKALFEIGSAVTLFGVKNYRHVFEAFLESGSTDGGSSGEAPNQPRDLDEVVAEAAEDEPSAAKAEQHTRDFVLATLLEFEPSEFEEFTADLLRSAGYIARATQVSGDRGVDVIAHRDPLGFEGVVKVQCKRSSAPQGSPVVNQLKGTLSSGEVGLFVCLGSYTSDARALEHTNQSIRLLGARDVVEMTLANYAGLSPRWRMRIPLRHVYVVDRDAEGY